MTATFPYAWLKELPPSALKEELSSPFGFPPPFPWEQLSAVFAKIFQLESFQLIPTTWQLREPQNFTEGLGTSPKSIFFETTQLQGFATWLIAEEDCQELMALILTRNDGLEGEIIQQEYQDAFLKFVALEAISICNKLEYQKDLSPHIADTKNLPEQNCYCQDIAIHLGTRTFTSRLLISEELRHVWKERFAKRSLEVQLPPAIAEKITVQLHLEAGYTTLHRSEWENASPGDCLLLDRSSIKLEEDKAQITISLNQKPLFLAQIKDGNIKILDYPLYSETTTTMTNNNHDDDDLDDDFEIDFGHTDAFDLEHTEHDVTAHSELEHSEHEHTEPQQPTTSEAQQPEPNASQPAAKTELKKSSTNETPFKIQDLPLKIVVEMGRLEMSIQKLAELAPGTVLELDLHPEDGVDLTINGHVIAKGELLKIGEVLGVRILDKAS